MSDLKVTCLRCKNELTHTCNGDIKAAVIRLLDWRPFYGMSKSVIADGKKSGYYRDGDENMPFVSEAYLYTLLGKEDARTFMALINSVLRDAGIDPNSEEIEEALTTLDEERELQEKRQAAAHVAYLARRKERLKTERAQKRKALAAKKNTKAAKKRRTAK